MEYSKIFIDIQQDYENGTVLEHLKFTVQILNMLKDENCGSTEESVLL